MSARDLHGRACEALRRASHIHTLLSEAGRYEMEGRGEHACELFAQASECATSLACEAAALHAEARAGRHACPVCRGDERIGNDIPCTRCEDNRREGAPSGGGTADKHKEGRY